MRKEEFLRKLEMLLSDISAEEREEAMAFYRSYFEDAGIGNEARIIADGAMKRSAEQAKNKHKGNKWWTDQLGLTNGGEACL